MAVLVQGESFARRGRILDAGTVGAFPAKATLTLDELFLGRDFVAVALRRLGGSLLLAEGLCSASRGRLVGGDVLRKRRCLLGDDDLLCSLPLRGHLGGGRSLHPLRELCLCDDDA